MAKMRRNEQGVVHPDIIHEMTDFHGRALPEPAEPAGYSWLIDRYGLNLPMLPRLIAIARRAHPRSTPDWLLLPSPRRPPPTLASHLAFAFRREGIDLSVLDALFPPQRRQPLFARSRPGRYPAGSGSCMSG